MKRLSFFLCAFVLLSVPALTLAAPLTNPLGVSTIQEFIARLIKIILGLSGSIALLMFVWGGFQYIWSAGDPGKVKKGKAAITNAVLGIFIIFFAYAAINAIINALTTGAIT